MSKPTSDHRTNRSNPSSPIPKLTAAAVRPDHSEQEAQTGAIGRCPLDHITLLEAYSRPVDHEHVDELATDIEQLGLIQPLVVDQSLRLVTGQHRYHALRLLRERSPSTFEERFVRAALARAGGHRGRTAIELGMTRQGLTKLMVRLGIAPSPMET